MRKEYTTTSVLKNNKALSGKILGVQLVVCKYRSLDFLHKI